MGGEEASPAERGMANEGREGGGEELTLMSVMSWKSVMREASGSTSFDTFAAPGERGVASACLLGEVGGVGEESTTV